MERIGTVEGQRITYGRFHEATTSRLQTSRPYGTCTQRYWRFVRKTALRSFRRRWLSPHAQVSPGSRNVIPDIGNKCAIGRCVQASGTVSVPRGSQIGSYRARLGSVPARHALQGMERRPEEGLRILMATHRDEAGTQRPLRRCRSQVPGRQRLAEHLDGTPKMVLCLREAALATIHPSQVGVNRGHVSMARPVGLPVDRHRLDGQRLGFPKLPQPGHGGGEGRHRCGQAGMLRLQRATMDAQRLAQQRLGLPLVAMRNDEETADGAVFVFRYDGNSWTQEDKLTPSDRRGGDTFGASVSIEGNIALVGAPRRTVEGTVQNGSAYVFRYDGTNWMEEAILTPADPTLSKYFGQSLSLSGSRALIGAWGDSPGGSGQNAGSAYVFDFDGSAWVQTAKLSPQEPASRAQFGVSVALSGDVALLGAPLDNELGGGAGAAYAFRLGDDGAWTEEEKLLADDYSGFNLFGSAVALSGAHAVVGAPNWFAPNEDATGKAYVYAYDQSSGVWQKQADLVPPDGGAGDDFGDAVAISEGVILVGSPEHDLPQGNVGAVYFYGTPAAPTAHELPDEEGAIKLSQAYPNPFQHEVTFLLMLSEVAPVRVRIFDLAGRQLRAIHHGHMPRATESRLVISAGDLPMGTYVVRVETAMHSASRLVSLVR